MANRPPSQPYPFEKIPCFCVALNCQNEIPNDTFFCPEHTKALLRVDRKKVDSVTHKGVDWRKREGRSYADGIKSAINYLALSQG